MTMFTEVTTHFVHWIIWARKLQRVSAEFFWVIICVGCDATLWPFTYVNAISSCMYMAGNA